MPDLFAVANSKFYIGGPLARKATPFVLGDFASQVWVEVDGWETAGAVGDASEQIATNLINTGRTVKQKGTADAGSMENNFAIIDNDPGQTLLKNAQASQSNYAFKIEWAGGDISYFIGLVMSKSRAGGNANTVQMLNATIDINSNVVEV